MLLGVGDDGAGPRAAARLPYSIPFPGQAGSFPLPQSKNRYRGSPTPQSAQVTPLRK